MALRAQLIQAQSVDEALLNEEPAVKGIYTELQVRREPFVIPRGCTLRGPVSSSQTWEWSHGQTPEFTHDLSTSFDWGDIVS